MRKTTPCPDCSDHVTRRQFLQAAAAGGAIAATAELVFPVRARADEEESPPEPPVASETLVAEFFKGLKDEQKKKVCFGFDDPLRQKVDNNWRITEARIGKDFDKDQQALLKDIFLGLHSHEYANKVLAQVEHDNQGHGGFGGCSIAMFGEPGTGKFEFVLSGRHVTRRCDGDSVEGAAFGGPIFYGHAAQGFHEPADHPGNMYWYQAKRANELFQALDGKQREQALLPNARDERGTNTVSLGGKKEDLAGIPISELMADQKELAEKVMEDVLAPFRDADRAESMKLIKDSGFDDLHLSYCKNLDVGDDGVWDVWQIEGPSMVWYFRGHPHVHTWVNIRASA